MEPLEVQEVGSVSSHFLDSGSFTLWTKAAEYGKKRKCPPWDYYSTQEFWDYCDSYAAFVKKHKIAIDLYANVDVIPNPELTWRNQQYLEEKHGLRPVPVVHYKTDLSWLNHYIGKGYEIIALGGLVGSTTQDHCKGWIDRAFKVVCDTPDHKPRVKVHGFGVTSYTLMITYPWWSVDSSSWTKVGAYGGVMVPDLVKARYTDPDDPYEPQGGHFSFATQPRVIKFSDKSPEAKELQGKHYNILTGREKAIMRRWLREINIPLGSYEADGETVKCHGVMTRHSERKAANLIFFERMRKSLPPYEERTFRSRRPGGFGLGG